MTRTRYGISPWIGESPKRRRPEFPRFKGEATYPVVIIGGGLAGIFTAHAFAAAGVKVALLEAARIGHGGASRGAGVLQGEAAPSYREVEERHGRKAARALFEASRRSVRELASAARRLGVKRIDTNDAFRVLSSYAAQEKALARDAQLRRDAGLDVTWLKPAAATRETGLDIGRAGMRLRDWGQANPYELLTTFASAAAGRGAAIFERSAVRRVKVRPKYAEVHAEAGAIRADTVIVCTGEPTDLYRSLKRHVRLDERYVVVTDRLPAALGRQVAPRGRVITDTEVPPHLVSVLDDGRVVMAGADQPRPPARGKEKVVLQRSNQLMYELSRMFPAISGVMPAYGWDVPIATTADGVMYAGPHRNFPRHLFAWATRHDPAQAFLASRILLRHFFGHASRDDTYFAFTRG
ncbi:MAG TPA: FAD-binding oxidoreductase [Vicinamibacterales bacterium]|nr:FAD-binding oxidoreductase [Vicinamibacterales bacterium]